MQLREIIENDLVTSLKAKDQEKIAVLRLVKSNLKNTAIAKRMSETELSEQDIVAVIRQEIKRRKESVAAFRAGAREELADKEERELNILSMYLPPSLSERELRAIIEAVVADEKLSPPLNVGKLMGVVMKKVAGRAGGDDVRRAVEAYVSS